MRHGFRRAMVMYAVVITAGAAEACAARSESTRPPAVLRHDAELDRIRAAVEKALVGAPAGGYAPVPKGVRLLSVAQDDRGAIVMDFSGELLDGGTGRVLEDALRQIFTAASAARTPAGRSDDYRVLVNGVTLESHLR